MIDAPIDLLSSLSLLALGLLLGILAGLLGTGGGTFAIPVLVLHLGFGQKLAQGTALVMVVGNVLKALLKYRSLSGMDWRLAAMLASTGSLSTTVSAAWALTLPSGTLQQGYGLFLIGLAAMVAWTHRTPVPTERRAAPWYWAALPGLIGGSSLGLFGVGGAMLAVPLLVRFFGQSQVRAQGLGLSLALPGCSISLWHYAASTQVDWWVGALLAVGGLLSVSYGVRLAHRLSEPCLVRVFCLALCSVGVMMYWH